MRRKVIKRWYWRHDPHQVIGYEADGTPVTRLDDAKRHAMMRMDIMLITVQGKQYSILPRLDGSYCVPKGCAGYLTKEDRARLAEEARKCADTASMYPDIARHMR